MKGNHIFSLILSKSNNTVVMEKKQGFPEPLSVLFDYLSVIFVRNHS